MKARVAPSLKLSCNEKDREEVPDIGRIGFIWDKGQGRAVMCEGEGVRGTGAPG
jgi:hypothetical protein